MTQVSFGDLASFYRSQLSNGRLKTQLETLSQEFATGKTSNLRAATGGDMGNYTGLETALKSLSAYSTAAKEVTLFAQTLQTSLETVQDTTSDVASSLILAGSTAEATAVQTAATDARSQFDTVVSVLNTKVADRALLAGTEIGRNAVADPEVMLADLQTAIAAETTAAGITAVVKSWFDDPGGGFETLGYLGGNTDLAAVRIGPAEEADLSFRADNQSLRDVLKGYAMASLVADGALSGDHEERTALVAAAGNQLLTSDYGLSGLRANVGTIEAKIDSSRARNSAEASALEMAQAGIVAIDPYQAAIELQAAENQLESLYTITARLSRLNLADYL